MKQKRVHIKGVQPSLTVENEKGELKEIKPEIYIRLLGVNLEENLSWNAHLLSGQKSLLPDLRKQLGSLKFISKEIPYTNRRILASGLIISRILYAITLWGGTYVTNQKKMQALLNKTARWVTNSGRRSKTLELMNKCGWLTVEEMISLHTILMCWKVIWLRIPLQLHERMTLNEDFSITTKKQRLQTVQAGYLWRATLLCNLLPQEICSIQSLPRFKSALKHHIVSQRGGGDEGEGAGTQGGGGDGGDSGSDSQAVPEQLEPEGTLSVTQIELDTNILEPPIPILEPAMSVTVTGALSVTQIDPDTTVLEPPAPLIELKMSVTVTMTPSQLPASLGHLEDNTGHTNFDTGQKENIDGQTETDLVFGNQNTIQAGLQTHIWNMNKHAH